MVCAMLTKFSTPAWGTILRVAYVTSLATKLSDTWGSEFGKVRINVCDTEGKKFRINLYY